jgi:hypothetical protein
MMTRTMNWLLLAAMMATTTVFSAEPVRTTSPTPAPTPTPVQSAGQPQSGNAPAKPSASSGNAVPDRLDLDVSVVTGNRELPKVLYIVPWKKAELGDLPEQPFNSLLDEALKPIDRDEFRREVAYFSKLAEHPAAADGAGEGKSPIAPTTSR